MLGSALLVESLMEVECSAKVTGLADEYIHTIIAEAAHIDKILTNSFSISSTKIILVFSKILFNIILILYYLRNV